MSSNIIEIEDLCPPGEILEETLEERGMTGAELARRTGLSEKHVSQLLRARVPLSTDVALSLEQVLGVPARLWNSIEFTYRSELHRQENRKDLVRFGEWMRKFPIAQMRRCGYFGSKEVGKSVAERVEALLRFFGVTTPEAWENQWEFATGQFRKSPSFDPNHFALTAWLRRGELESESIRCEAYDEEIFRAALREARKLTTQPANRFVPKLVALCAGAGVALTFVPALPKLAISGVTRWKDSSRAQVSLSLRHMTDDQLWFSFFHEACHVLEHKTRTIYIDSPADPNSDPAERRANDFARDVLIPADRFVELQRSPPSSKAAIKRFASSIGIAPGIVVGQLQHLGALPRSHCNELKQRFEWNFETSS